MKKISKVEKAIKSLVKKSVEFKQIVENYHNQKDEDGTPNCLFHRTDCKALWEKLGSPTLPNYGEESLEEWENFIYLLGECLMEATDCNYYYYSEGLSI